MILLFVVTWLWAAYCILEIGAGMKRQNNGLVWVLPWWFCILVLVAWPVIVPFAMWQYRKQIKGLIK